MSKDAKILKPLRREGAKKKFKYSMFKYSMLKYQYSMCRNVIMVFAFVSIGMAQAQEVRKIKAVELEKIITESKHPLIINFWATWCGPCIEEIPYFLDEAKKYRKDSLSILLVSLDFKE